MNKKKKWSSEAKFKIAVEAIKGEVPLNELCKKYEVSPSQVHLWKKQLIEQGSALFTSKTKETKQQASYESERKRLHEKIGALTVERDFLKECWSKLHGK